MPFTRFSLSKDLVIRQAVFDDLDSLSEVCCSTFIETYDGKGKDSIILKESMFQALNKDWE